MKTITPNYYANFKCIADRCRHSCCIGWEIDIDPDTLERYQRVSGDFGARLRAEIDDQNNCFRLDEKERCPFLNQQGLCDIISTLGEESLCRICTDHPRFRNYFSSHIEMGLGLCCEEAARLILTQNEPFSLTELPQTNDPAERVFFDLRNRLFDMIQNDQVPFSQRLGLLPAVCGGGLPQKTASEWGRIFQRLEQLEPQWSTLLSQLCSEHNLPQLSTQWDNYSARLLIYFVYRHLSGALEDRRLGARAAFCALSVQMIRHLAALLQRRGMLTIDSFLELARLYSAEIEYSDENTEFLFDLLS
ncbi:MAG: flagellin lysine-N-methylase [Clostridia bacterium]|nr:flagellin lysine-N-methylase [Clostridia bacterium]